METDGTMAALVKQEQSRLRREHGRLMKHLEGIRSLEKYPDQNVVIYGNSTNNMAWASLLGGCPLQVVNGRISMQGISFDGGGYGIYFIYPRPDSDIASVGVVSATGAEGMKATYANLYLENGTTFPDLVIVNSQVIKDGVAGIEGAGFFGNDWSFERGDFVWREQVDKQQIK